MNTPKTPSEGLGDVDDALAGSADLRSPFGSGDGPVVELFDSGVPGRIVAHMPSGPLDGKVDFISYLDLDAPLAADGLARPLEIIIVPSFYEGF